MSANLRTAILATASLLLVVVAARGVAAARPPRAIVEIAFDENRVDGCTACGCRLPGEILDRGRGSWWLAFGVVRPSPGGDWSPVATSTYCGRGPFEAIAADLLETAGTPYLTADVSLVPAGSSREGSRAVARIAVRRLTGFSPEGAAAYSSTSEDRVVSLDPGGDLALPLLIAGAPGRDAFGVHEVMLRLRTIPVPDLSRTYGSIALSSDIPGARILLDGGYVGRVAAGAPALLATVPSGDRDIRVVDFSGREARRTVRVTEGRTTAVELRLLEPVTGPPANGLRPVGRNPQGYEEFWRAADGALVVEIPGGAFSMGSPEGRGEPNERPRRQVHVSTFLIDKTEVTWRQMRAFAAATGRSLPPSPVSGSPDHFPASNVLWEEAAAYCAWAGGRLPTEAEWEKAARGTDGRDYLWGDRFESDRCNSISGGLHQVEDVGSYPGCLSPYGVLDMAGGMWEWCADWYADTYYSSAPGADPRGPDTGTLRSLRGGAWMSQPTWVRAAYRVGRAPSSRNVDNGFRCAQEALPE